MSFKPSQLRYFENFNCMLLLIRHRRSLYSYFIEIITIFDVNSSQQICFKIVIYTLYNPLNNLCKFHKDQTSSLAVPAV